jgi:hypothetical protein
MSFSGNEGVMIAARGGLSGQANQGSPRTGDAFNLNNTADSTHSMDYIDEDQSELMIAEVDDAFAMLLSLGRYLLPFCFSISPLFFCAFPQVNLNKKKHKLLYKPYKKCYKIFILLKMIQNFGLYDYQIKHFKIKLPL